ncbi:MAG: lysophospholipid acyltransferase family protein [Kiritimatiellaeota bacterium]|nr:lysophospholipid acyltransferase family protein [Kiritimatiellota bacterium]
MGLKRQIRRIRKPPVWIFAPLVFFLRLMKFCMNTEVRDPNGCLNTETYPYITVTWHNRLLFFPAMFPAYARKKTVAMISASRDGQYLAGIVGFFGIGVVRGSTSKRGAAALRGAITCLESGCNVSITPDGPRGPKYKMSRGPVILASKTGIPVLPIEVAYSSYWEAGSWDNFRIPKPWAKTTLILGDPIEIPPDLSEPEIEEWRRLLEQKLNALCQSGSGAVSSEQ